MSFHTLPNEILLIIFNYCNVQDLIKMSGVCKTFYHIASEILIKEWNHLLITGQMSKIFCERCQPLLSSCREKFYIHNNWKRGKYENKIFYPKPVTNRRCSYKNCLQITKDMILFVSDYNLCAFNRTINGSVSNDNVIVGNYSSDVLDILLPRNDIILTTHSNCSIQQWTIESLHGKKYFNKKLQLRPSCSNPYSYCYVMDATPESIIIDTCTGGIQLCKYIFETNSIMDNYIIPDLTRTFNQNVRFATFDPTGTKFATGNYCRRNNDGSFIIYDIKKCCTEINIKTKDLDSDLWFTNQILWEEPNDILSLTKYKVIKTDARTHKIVNKWFLPFNCFIGCSWKDGKKFKCMSTDNQYAIMTGASHGKVFLWDQRQSNTFIQVYNTGNVSCVDSLRFDSSRMYVAADKLYEFDFTKI